VWTFARAVHRAGRRTLDEEAAETAERALACGPEPACEVARRSQQRHVAACSEVAAHLHRNRRSHRHNCRRHPSSEHLCRKFVDKRRPRSGRRYEETIKHAVARLAAHDAEEQLERNLNVTNVAEQMACFLGCRARPMAFERRNMTVHRFERFRENYLVLI